MANCSRLGVMLAGIKLKNPVIAASGTYGFGEEYAPFLDLKCLGAITLKGVTLAPRKGNKPPRIVETPAGLLNSIGLENPGVEEVTRAILPRAAKLNVPLIVNIAGETVEEYAEVAARLEGKFGVAALEVNISCPNVEKGCLSFGSDPKAASEVILAVKENTSFPVITKLSPNAGNIVSVAMSVAEAGTDAISLINTVKGMSINVRKRCPELGNITGGLSGPAIKPIAVCMTWEVAREVKNVPLIGMGGIMCAEDALEFILAGASAVEVGTGNFVNPRVTLEIIEGLENYCMEQGVKNITELVGAAWKEG